MSTGIVAIVSLFIVLPAVILHYVTKMRSQKGLSPEEEHMLKDLWRDAKRMEDRLEAMEAILEIEPPKWQDIQDKTHHAKRSGRPH